jgi:flavin reductase (DIM6/NTAB) family NADH-FMN oxidoreductase RutF
VVAVSEEEFKACMGCRVTAVSIVTARDGDRIHGMTVSDFTSVSLRPPLVLVCADKNARTLELIRAGRCFAINILAEDQHELSNLFADKSMEDQRFDGLDTAQGTTGAPLISEAQAILDCSLEAEHDAGDHVLCIGRVEEVRIREAEPLVYFKGAYRSLAAKG